MMHVIYNKGNPFIYLSVLQPTNNMKKIKIYSTKAISFPPTQNI